MILATDLDGTMAHGDSETRARLVDAVRASTGGALVYVTGRAPESVRRLADRMALPVPDVLIADVGTSVLHGFGPEHVSEIERELDARWPGRTVIEQRLAALEGRISLQDVRSPRRLSYWIESVRAMRSQADDPFAAVAADDPSLGPEGAAEARAVAEDAERALAGMAVDIVVSSNVFLDVLPAGVDKGSTLRRVLEWLGVDDRDCVVAGDSLNDLGLFRTGIRGILVGNCEPSLRRRVSAMESVYAAAGEGVAGILEGLSHYGLVTPDRVEGGRGGE